MSDRLEIGPWRMAVAVDEAQAKYEITDWLVWQDSEPNRCPEFELVRAILEIRRAGGGIVPRALLGGQLRHTHGLRFRVDRSTELTHGTSASCPSSLSTTLVPGLPDEFAQAVLDGLVRVPITTPSCGELIVDRAAYDEVESSPIAFERAAGLLRGVLTAKAKHRDEIDEIRRLMTV